MKTMDNIRYKRIVIKTGTSTLTHPTGRLNLEAISKLAQIISDIMNAGHEIILVSSGAIAAGMSEMGLSEKPAELKYKQACAAIGQSGLMHIYRKLFAEYGRSAAQILLTRADVRQSPHNLLDTINALLLWGVLPIVNENDSVSPDEIECAETSIFGDNDTLSAVVAELTGAGLLVLLTDIDALYDSDPRVNPKAAPIPLITEITEALKKSASGPGSVRGTGGMITKLQAAEIALANGFDMVITQGSNPAALYQILRNQPVGTLFRKL